MAISASSISYILKQLYPEGRINDLVYQDNPLLAMIPKEKGMGGEVTVIPTKYADAIGQSATFAQAQATSGSGNKGVKFLVTRVKDYQIYAMETEAILAAESNREAFVRSLDDTVKGALNNFGRTRGIDLYRDGVGERGQISVAGTTFTLANPNDITNFEVGRVIVVSTGSTKTDALRNSGAGMTIVSVNRDNGSFVVDANSDSASTGDWVFFKGDRQAAAITGMSQWLRLSGLEAWNPASAPGGSDSFFGVNRSVDASRLAGLRIDISALNPEEGLVTAIHRVAREGGNPKHMFLNNIDAKNIHLALGAKAITEYQKVGNIGFSSIRVTGPKGDFNVYSDQNAPSGVGRLLQLDTWKLRFMRKLAYIQDLDGTDLLRQASSDSYEGRVAFYGNLTNQAPGWNARLVMPT